MTTKKVQSKKSTVVNKSAATEKIPRKKISRGTSRAKKSSTEGTRSGTTSKISTATATRTTTQSHVALSTALVEEVTQHPEHAILLIGEYYLIAVLCAIIGISCMYAILALW